MTISAANACPGPQRISCAGSNALTQSSFDKLVGNSPTQPAITLLSSMHHMSLHYADSSGKNGVRLWSAGQIKGQC
jgi:hypothetical protein